MRNNVLETYSTELRKYNRLPKFAPFSQTHKHLGSFTFCSYILSSLLCFCGKDRSPASSGKERPDIVNKVARFRETVVSSPILLIILIFSVLSSLCLG
ncbi:predicted protein [Methanosarcina acetivorans C2A]|uniref:Uncharacterized protein n=1 Tax=Methanosarcina acetivorans (strain ATCC 35395 / DSM 2834 / JCM 12185 / C2A) TaxID=188937 RepID=Q8TL40_METAC|nr:predicted protein [Methanosarcina acetivorans C2A]